MAEDPEHPERAPREPDTASPRIVTWCHECAGRGATWMPRAAVLQNLPAMAAQMQCCPTCEGSGRLPGMQPPA